MQLGDRVRTVWDGRRRSIERARLSANASLPREGKLRRQIRRCMLAHNQPTIRWPECVSCVPGAIPALSASTGITATSPARLSGLELGASAGAYMQHDCNMICDCIDMT